MKEKQEEEKTKPKDLYRGIYHAYAGSSEIKHLINKGQPDTKAKKAEPERSRELTDIEKKSFAVNTHANYNLKKQGRSDPGDSKTGSGFSAYFARAPKSYLKSF